ncbi:MAG: hypothetical protein M3Z66_06450, partial [Chloroflexota bacterium]|nr:hypothetical protein [Chloroflexota bacterium]
ATPTAVRIGRVLIQHRGAILRLSWRLSRVSGVVGFDLYAGRHRLNARLIPVHRSPVYRYQIPWRGTGPYRVLVLLTSGGAVSVSAR